MSEISVLQKSEVAEGGSQALSVVPDITQDLQLVARNAGEMKQAQTAMATWFGEKREIARKDLADLEESLEIAKKNGWQLAALQRQVRNARARYNFYDKCTAASEAGYCIIPNLPVDTFAIRTHRRPKYNRSENQWSASHQYTTAPPRGEGVFVSDHTSVNTSERIEKRSDGSDKLVTTYFTDHFVDVEFPISVARPIVMNATAEAMALQCFDEIGVLPERWITKRDPIVVGTILKPGRKAWDTDGKLMFLIAWYVDTRAL